MNRNPIPLRLRNLSVNPTEQPDENRSHKKSIGKSSLQIEKNHYTVSGFSDRDNRWRRQQGKECESRKNKLYRSDDGSLRPKPMGETEEIPADLVFRSVGYRGIPLQGVPFDDSSGVIPNEKGRVLDKTGGNPVSGFYTTGWIKRGPTGVIGTNKTDSGETVGCMIEDIERENTLRPEFASPDSIKELLEEKHISYNEWLRVDSFEKRKRRKTGKTTSESHKA